MAAFAPLILVLSKIRSDADLCIISPNAGFVKVQARLTRQNYAEKRSGREKTRAPTVA
jgi:hypothetical protein